MSKVEVIQGVALIAVSGPVGLGQCLTGEFDRMLAGGLLKGAPYKVMTDLRGAFWKQIKPEFESAAVAKDSIGAGIATQSAISTTLLAMNVGGTARLFTFGQQGSPEEITAKMPVVSAGSGQRNADVFLAFLRGVYWEEGAIPSLAEGEFIALWALTQCIETSAGGLQGPARVFTLKVESGKAAARQIPDAELDEHRVAIDNARAALRRAREETPGPPVPSPE
jgi:hypothetical protein